MTPVGAAPEEDRATAGKGWFDSSRDLKTGLAVTDFGGLDDVSAPWPDTQGVSDDWPDTISTLPEHDGETARLEQLS